MAAEIDLGMVARQYNRLTDDQKSALFSTKKAEAVAKFGGSKSDWKFSNFYGSDVSGQFGHNLVLTNTKLPGDPPHFSRDGTLISGSIQTTGVPSQTSGTQVWRLTDSQGNDRGTTSDPDLVQRWEQQGGTATVTSGRGGGDDPNIVLQPERIGDTQQGNQQVGDPIRATREEILELFTLGPANGGWTRERVISELGNLGFQTIQINTMLAGVRQPPTVTTPADPFFPNRQGTDAPLSIGNDIFNDIPGGKSSFQEELDRLDAVGGRRGVFDALANKFTSGLSNVGRASVGSRFAPLEASFLTNEGLQGLNTGQATSFEGFLQGNPQSLSPQDLLERLSSIGSRVNTGESSSFLDFFLNNAQARNLFDTAATTGINPAFRNVQRGALDREFNQFLFENPFESVIGEIGRRGGRVFR